jgi:hypothetical protein
MVQLTRGKWKALYQKPFEQSRELGKQRNV